jgi:hypothetical protein
MAEARSSTTIVAQAATGTGARPARRALAFAHGPLAALRARRAGQRQETGSESERQARERRVEVGGVGVVRERQHGRDRERGPGEPDRGQQRAPAGEPREREQDRENRQAHAPGGERDATGVVEERVADVERPGHVGHQVVEHARTECHGIGLATERAIAHVADHEHERGHEGRREKWGRHAQSLAPCRGLHPAGGLSRQDEHEREHEHGFLGEQRRGEQQDARPSATRACAARTPGTRPW